MINIAVVGAGNWGKNLVRTFAGLPGANLHTCCDLNDKLLENVKKQYPETGVTKNLEALLDNPEIQGVVVASSAVTHFEVARKALLADKHVYVEKPICLNEKDVIELIRISDEKGKKLMVGHLLLYHPAIRRMKEVIDSGEMGDIYYAYSQRVNLGKIRKEENALWSFAPHDISVILYLFNEEPDRVSCEGESYLQKDVEDVVFLHLHFKDKKMAHIQLSWLDPQKIRKTTIVGSRKMMVFDDMDSSEKIRIYDKGADINQGEYVSYDEMIKLRDKGYIAPELDLKEPLVNECRHFVDCIEKNEKPLTDGRNGLRVVRVLNAAQKSLENKGVPERL